ncbi:TetR/AcrR family transcriptional regulator [Actinoplanes sp. CA-131856]
MTAEPSAHVRQRPAVPIGKPRDSERDHRILEAVLDLLSEQGPGAISMEAVAAHAGVAKSTVYRRWGNMSDLLADAVDTLQFPVTPHTQTGHLREDLIEGIIGASGCLDARRLRIVNGLLSAAQSHPELVEAFRRRVIDAIAEVMAAAVHGSRGGDATAGLSWPGADIHLAAVIGLMMGLPHVTGRPLEHGDFERIVDEAVLPLLESRLPAP